MSAALETRALRCGYGARPVLEDLSVAFEAGALTAVLGPNGAGKSTLLKAVAGLVPSEGEVTLFGRPLATLSRRDVAREVAVVAQDPPADVPFTVAELVLMGRTPHLPRLGLEGPHDRAVAAQAMDAVDVSRLAARSIDALSGGEKRRVFLARALAQEPKLLLLDEPTAFLDLGHQAELLHHCRAQLARGLTVVAALHDPNLAAAFADRAILLKDGKVFAQGPVREVLTRVALEALYGASLVEARGASGEGPFFGPR